MLFFIFLLCFIYWETVMRCFKVVATLDSKLQNHKYKITMRLSRLLAISYLWPQRSPPPLKVYESAILNLVLLCTSEGGGTPLVTWVPQNRQGKLHPSLRGCSTPPTTVSKFFPIMDIATYRLKIA